MKEIVILAAIILLSASCALVPDGVYQEPTNSAVMSEMEGIADDSSQDKSSSYVNVAFAYYEDVSEDRERHVTIEYPQVFNLSNADFQKELNEKLSPPYYDGDEDDGLTLEMRSDYSFVGDRILSFRFYRFVHLLTPPIHIRICGPLQLTSKRESISAWKML